MSSSSMQTPVRTTIILTGPNDWDEWIEVVKTKAEAGRIWDYVDPSKSKEEVKTLSRPEIPMAKDVNPGKNTMAELTPDEQEELKLLRFDYKHRVQLYERQDIALSSLKGYIQETISRTFLSYTFKKESTHEVLIALKQRVAPTDRARKLELSQRYARLRKTPKSQSVEVWLQSWEQTYTECKDLKLPIVEDNLPLYDFLHAVSELAPEFSSVWTVNLETMEAENKTLPDIFRIIGLFRDHQCLANARKGKAASAFPVTLKDQVLEPSSGDLKDQKEAKTDTKKKTCICGAEHRFSTCPYLIESKRPQGWTPDPEIQKVVDEKLKIPGVKKGVERARQSVKEKEQDKTSEKAGVFMTAVSYSDSTDYNLRDSFILDSGATVHVCNSRRRFATFTPASEDDLLYAGNTVVPIEGFGSVDITIQTPAGPRLIELQHTALISSFHTSVVSLKCLVAKGVYWDMQNNRLTRDGMTFCSVESHHDQWTLEYKPLVEPSAFVARSAKPLPPSEASPLTWHLRLGHPHSDIIEHLPQAVIGAKIGAAAPSTKAECETCGVSKATAIVSRRPGVRPTGPYEWIAFDLVHMTKGYNDEWIFLHLFCLRCSMNHVYTLSDKKESTLLKAIKQFVAFVKTRYNCTVQGFRTDGERSLGKKFLDWIKSKGITLETSAPYTPEQNGSAERSGGVIISRARAMRVHANLPEDLWPEIVPAAAYVLNRTPNRQLDWKTPLETLQQLTNMPNPRPSIAHLRVYGSRAYPLIYKIPKSEKLKPRAHIGYLVGYDSSNIFRIWVPSKKQVVRTRDVTFDETLFYDPAIPDLAKRLRAEVEQVIEVIDMASSQPLIDGLDLDLDSDSDSDLDLGIDEFQPYEPYKPGKAREIESSPSTSLDHRLPTPAETMSSDSTLSRLQTPFSADSDSAMLEGSTNGQAESYITPRQTHTNIAPRASEISSELSEDHIISERTRRRQAYLTTLQEPKKLHAYSSAFATGLKRLHRDQLPPPPRSWKELLRHPQHEGFRAAAEKEYRDLERRHTFRPVPKTQSLKPLPLMWVFTYKFDTEGYLTKYKARLCVRGDLQDPTHLDTYATTLAARLFRTLIAIMAAFDLEARQYDAVNAFANSLLDEVVYCTCPEGYAMTDQCWLLLRALYGLRRSPLLWLKEFSKTLKELGLQEVPGEPCLFTNSRLIVFFYVDDIVVLCPKQHLSHLETFEKNLMDCYEI